MIAFIEEPDMRGPVPPVVVGILLVTVGVLLSLNACGGGTTIVSSPPVPPLSIVTTSLPPGVVDILYAGVTLQATGGVPPYTWAVTTGTLPSGLTLSGATAAISGTVATAGVSSFTVIVTDSERPTKSATASLSITITLPVQKIEHVVVIFQENRTTDNLFQDPLLIARGADIVNTVA